MAANARADAANNVADIHRVRDWKRICFSLKMVVPEFRSTSATRWNRMAECRNAVGWTEHATGGEIHRSVPPLPRAGKIVRYPYLLGACLSNRNTLLD